MTQNILTNNEKIKEKSHFWPFYVRIKLNFQAVIKSAASADSRKESRGAPWLQLGMRTVGDG